MDIQLIIFRAIQRLGIGWQKNPLAANTQLSIRAVMDLNGVAHCLSNVRVRDVEAMGSNRNCFPLLSGGLAFLPLVAMAAAFVGA